jgi:predicted O-methyltransferase YrrM
MLNEQKFQIFMPTQQENEGLQEMNDFYKGFNEMNQAEREFLNALILRHKPKNLLELGVSAGGASVVILNAIKNIENAKLHSIDYCENWYKDSSKKSGWIVEHYPVIKQKLELHTGGMSFTFIENIGKYIDFVLIDTMHCCPGEILDILMVLPFLADDAIVVFHDTNLHTQNKKGKPHCSITEGFVGNLLISSLFGEKILQGNFDRKKCNCPFPNIAAVQLKKESKEHAFELFNLLTLKWNYLPEKDELQKLVDFIEKYYGSYFADYFKDVCTFQRIVFFCNLTFKNKVRRILPKSVLTRLRNIYWKMR